MQQRGGFVPLNVSNTFLSLFFHTHIFTVTPFFSHYCMHMCLRLCVACARLCV